MKAQHEGALPPPCIVRKDPRVWKGEAKADAGTLVRSLPPWPEADDSESGHDMEGNWSLVEVEAVSSEPQRFLL